MSQSIAFASMCPNCKRAQPQEFTTVSLALLLKGGYPIEAYCMRCEEFWSINDQQRNELVEALASAHGGTPPSMPVPRHP